MGDPGGTAPPGSPGVKAADAASTASSVSSAPREAPRVSTLEVAWSALCRSVLMRVGDEQRPFALRCRSCVSGTLTRSVASPQHGSLRSLSVPCTVRPRGGVYSLPGPWTWGLRDGRAEMVSTSSEPSSTRPQPPTSTGWAPPLGTRQGCEGPQEGAPPTCPASWQGRRALESESWVSTPVSQEGVVPGEGKGHLF